jgi:hypothetical protein
MSLTVALDDPRSSSNAFFDKHLPHYEPFTRPWMKTLRRRAWTKTRPASRAPHLVGAAIEIRVGLDLAQVLPYGDLVTAITSTAGRDTIRALGYEPPAGSDEDLTAWRKVAAPNDHHLSNDHDHQVRAATLCWQMAYIESIAHALSKTALDTPDNLSAFWTQVHPDPPAESIDVLLGLWHKYHGAARSTLTGFGGPTTIRPSFASLFAVGDLLLGDTLIEVKCELRPEASLARTLRQVVACALADSDDELSIKNVGVYHAYEGSLVHWPLEQVLQRLSPTGHTSLAELRACFTDTIAAERQSIEKRNAR